MCLPAGGRFDGKIVLRKPIDEREQNGNGSSKPKKAKAGA
jgi:hypothetical protein